MKQTDLLRHALTEMPATAQELAIETGVPLRNVPVLLARLMSAGLVQRAGHAPASLQYGRRTLVQYAIRDD